MNQIINIVFATIITTLLVGCGQKNENASTTENSSTASSEQPGKHDSQALYEEARNFHSGLNGVAVDKAKAYELFSQSAEMGNGGAMFFLGVMNERGESVPVDEQKALDWYEKSDKAGCGAAAPNLKALKAKMATEKKK